MKKYKKFIPIVIIICVLLIISIGASIMTPQEIPVLTYHDFSNQNESQSMMISSKEFEKQMKYLSKHHYHSLTLEEVDCFMDNTCKIPRKSVLITIDDGWKNTLEIAAPILKKYDLKATIFYIGKNINGNNEHFLSKKDLGIIREKYPNIEIASHSFDLHQENAFQLSKEDLMKDFERMKPIVSSPYYAYPYGLHSENYHEALKEEGYHLAFTFGPSKEHRKMSRKDNRYELPRLNMSDGMPFWKFILRLII